MTRLVRHDPKVTLAKQVKTRCTYYLCHKQQLILYVEFEHYSSTTRKRIFRSRFVCTSAGQWKLFRNQRMITVHVHELDKSLCKKQAITLVKTVKTQKSHFLPFNVSVQMVINISKSVFTITESNCAVT